MRFRIIGLALLASFAMARPCLSQCSNVNLLTEEGWEELLDAGNVPEEDWAELIDCVFDWIDADDNHRLNGAESDDPFYIGQGYSVSNAPLTTVTELLLVKGFDTNILYGGTNLSGIVLTGIVYHLTTWSTNGLCDFDSDTMPDWYEDGYDFLHPTNSTDGAADQDADFLSNTGEYEWETDPEDPDTDDDRMLDGHEIIAATDPRNPASFLEMEAPSPAVTPSSGSGIIVQWQSVTDRQYKVARATTLLSPSPFSVVASNITGEVSSTQFTDTTATATMPFFYRVEIDENE